VRVDSVVRIFLTITARPSGAQPGTPNWFGCFVRSNSRGSPPSSGISNTVADKVRQCASCPGPDTTGVPADLGPGGFLYGLGELMRLHQQDLSSLFTRTTGGQTLSFLKKNALEQAIQLVGEEVHRQYILSFEPKGGEPGKFHTIRAVVKGRPELQTRTREGYWAL